MKISKMTLIDSINNCQSIEKTIDEKVDFVDKECKAQWNENFYREYWEFVRDFIGAHYGEELTEDEMQKIYDKVMERA